jgi:hypothetical protein
MPQHLLVDMLIEIYHSIQVHQNSYLNRFLMNHYRQIPKLIDTLFDELSLNKEKCILSKNILLKHIIVKILPVSAFVIP